MSRIFVLAAFTAGCVDYGKITDGEASPSATTPIPDPSDTDVGGDTDVPATTDTPGDTGTSDTDTTPYTPPVDDSVQQLCVDTINAYRDTLGLPHYARWSSAEACTDGEAEADSISGTPHGAFGSCGEFAQNECPGWPLPYEDVVEDCLAMMWAEGPGADFQQHGHYINMSSSSYSEVACGFFTTPGGSVWAIQNFR